MLLWRWCGQALLGFFCAAALATSASARLRRWLAARLCGCGALLIGARCCCRSRAGHALCSAGYGPRRAATIRYESLPVYHSATESQQIWRSGLAEEYKPIRARPCRCAGGLTIRVITVGRFRGAKSQPRRGRALRHTRSRSQHPKAPALHLTAYLTQPLGPGPARFRSVLEDSFGQNKYNQSKVNTISPKFLLTIGKKKRHRKVKSVRITALQSHHSESNQGHSDVCNPLQSDALPTELW